MKPSALAPPNVVQGLLLAMLVDVVGRMCIFFCATAHTVPIRPSGVFVLVVMPALFSKDSVFCL